MANYSGPAAVTLADGTKRGGTAVLRSVRRRRGGLIDWRGTFVPDGDAPVNAGTATIEVNNQSADVLIQDWRFDGRRGIAVLLGQNEPPF